MKNICFVTGTRAEYGLLQPLMKLFKESREYTLQIIVTGMHLSPEFGLTYTQIEKDGYEIDDKVEILLSSDTPAGVAKSTGLGFLAFPDSYSRLKPDLVVVLGDRYEIFAAAATAYFMHIPLAHLHGGETTEGAIDEGIRHAVSKMATLHFTSTQTHRKRVIQLGESPQRVYNVGAIGIDNIAKLPLLSREDLATSIGHSLENPFFLITYHPVTLSSVSEEKQLRQLFEALDEFPDVTPIFTLPNSDSGGRSIIELIQSYAEKRSDARVFTSLGQLRYLSAVKEAAAVVGNSSSGIIEAPSLGTPTVNIGIRQKGRESAQSVLHCKESAQSIRTALEKTLTEEFQRTCKTYTNPYGDGQTSDKIFTHIDENIESLALQKSFFDIEYTL
jgi:UDP-hydrolysing UDP-N-acetyl-D-glucosamine 2-epimerase